ncbi:MAG: hypothetical protein BACD_00174 [Bacteroides rodentium]
MGVANTTKENLSGIPPEKGTAAVRASPPGSIEDKHHTRGHAVCSASSSKMWSHCTPSARLQELFPNESSVYAERGTFVHELGEYKLKRAHKKRVKRPQSEEFDDEEAERNSDLYVETIIETEEAMKIVHGEVLMLVEEKLDFSSWVPDGFGSGDCLLIAPGEIHVFDYKNGFNFVPVCETDDNGVTHPNSQLALYALGAVSAYDFLFDFQLITLHIIQPNAENIAEYTLSRAELMEFGEWIRPLAKMAYEGVGEQVPGEHCRWCRAKPVCEARKREALALAQGEFIDLDANTGVLDEQEESDATAAYCPDTDTVVFKQPMLVAKEEIERILPILNRISDWIDSVFAYVSGEAMHGTKWKGYKLVQGRSKRVFTDIKAVEKKVIEAGYSDIYKQELLTLTEFEKLMGKKNFASVLGELVVKPPGKLTLVPESDPRDEVNIDSGPTEFDTLEDPPPDTQLNKETKGTGTGALSEGSADEGLPFC